jgi:DNA polymerase II small subunit/DNA polymerase delta subunit B
MIINDLFNDTASSSHYVMLNGNMVDWIGKYVEESS